ncbi:MAG: 3-hydroxyacyl-CoA dehydrogenase NAD-binding domain-containing protein [Paracoccaceae bacterium]|nr:3-hydroxyacyl-CoA dehydrogenase NAD-binding domain-containing protein [Paracoccaceae bacterium]
MGGFRFATDHRGIATITWDVPGRAMNVMDFEQLEELEGLVDRVLADETISGAIVTSAKSGFSGGMNLEILAGWRSGLSSNAGDGKSPAAQAFDRTMSLHRLLRKIECGRPGWGDPGGPAKPFAAALTGTALGIGYEIALACHRIFVADRPDARIGLPEIRVGLFPGGGGTTRLTRRLGLMEASRFLFEGRLLAPAPAVEAGLADTLVPPDELDEAARDWVAGTNADTIVKPWDAPGGGRVPGGTPYHPKGFMTFVGASAQVHGRTRGVFPAAKAMLSAIYEGALVPFDTALRIEARWFVSALLHPSSTAMINTLFLSKRALEKGVARPAGVESREVNRLAVLGAGVMGAGIGYVAAAAGIRVVLLDRDMGTAKQGRQTIATLFEGQVKRGRITPEERDRSLENVVFTDRYEDLAESELVIEAVFEDPAVKSRVIADAAAELNPETVIATNTSTLPIASLASAAGDERRFLGMHFFSPVHKMKLLEIIRGPKTGPKAIGRALDLARQIGKTPIVVNDARFFYANRCIIPYINEGVRMVAEGVSPALIENAAKRSGMPLGPLQLVDETSIDLGVSIARVSRAAMGENYPPDAAIADDVLEKLASLGRLGRKSRGGFYAYDSRGRRKGLWAGLGEQWPLASVQPDVLTVQHRLMLIQALEAVKALEDGVLTDVREGDVGAVLGWGFAPSSGGPFSWLDRIGPAEIVSRCDRLRELAGARFDAPESLRKMARSGNSFYGHLLDSSPVTA